MQRNKQTEKTWRRFWGLLLLAVLVLGGWLWRAVEGDKGTSLYFVMAKEGVLTGELQEQLGGLPGLAGLGRACVGNLETGAENYRMEGQIYGVELGAFPFVLSASSGEISYGDQFLLVLGNESLNEMVDENQTKITERRKQALLMMGGELSVKLEGEEEGKILGINGSKNMPDTKIYGEFHKTLSLLEKGGGEFCQGMWILIEGKKNAQKVRQALEKADFLEWSQ